MAEEFMHKNKLQEYAQRSAIPLPIYNTVNEGSPHGPRFRSSVIVDGSRFTSNCTFSNKKAAEQYAAKYALEAIRSFIRNNSLSLIPNNSAIFKSILYEYAVKMNLKLPTYETCTGLGTIPMFISSVSFDNKTFKGEFGRSKKEAEQIGARAVIKFILGNSDSGTVMTQIIKSKAKLDASVPKLNGSSSSEIENAVMIGPMVHQSNVNQLEMKSTPNCDPSTSFQPCYPEPPSIATFTNASAGDSVPSRTVLVNLCQRCSELISNEKCPEFPDVAVATGRSTSDISNNAHSEQNTLHPEQGKSEMPSDDSGNHSSDSQGNASKKRHKRENEQSLKKARVDEALTSEPHAPE
ncbi:double-stranded RNA-binding protein 1-like isoform X1 [Zingiber officinale]|uniref:double-stranded RNA-binding protein 1-like isoform X1 n=1 Tax=Zingiber officinale TaxID=94328 RepID=UPI001C4D1A72|nr:double-stranded RNA-binding protein 1-like isoform X1 [Zingiber officinale]